MVTRDTDGNIRQATDLGTLTNQTITRSNSLNAFTSDFRDFYSFNLSVRSSVNIAAGRAQDNIALGLLNSRGRRIEVSNRPGNRNERVRADLAPGTYFVAVVLFGVRTSYGIRLRSRALEAVPPPPGPAPGDPGTPTDPTDPTGPPVVPPLDPEAPEQPNQELPPGPPPIIPSPDPGSIPADAFDIGVLGDTVTYQQTVGGVDENGNGVLDIDEIDFGDFYRFTVTEPSEVQLLTGNVSEGSVQTRLIYDINNNGLLDTSDVERFTEVLASGNTIQRSLGAGTYFVGITLGGGGNVTYSFQLSQTPVAPVSVTPDPPIFLSSATDLGVLPTGATSVRQRVDVTDPIDVYKFNLTNPVSNVSLLLDLTQLTGDITLSVVFDVNGDGIASPTRNFFGGEGVGDFVLGTFTSSGNGNSAILTLEDVLTNGEYYLVVTQRGIPLDDTFYNLQIFNTPISLSIPDPGNSIATATPVSFLPPADPVNYSQFTQIVGASDDADFYSFTVPGTPGVLAEAKNITISYRGRFVPTALRLINDRNGNGIVDTPEDGTGVVFVDGSPQQVGERNGFLDTVVIERVDANGDPAPPIIGTEDRNGNGILDANEVLEPEPTINLRDDQFPVEYNPLPPFPLPSDGVDSGRGGTINGTSAGYELDPGTPFPPGTGGFDFTDDFEDLFNAYVTATPTLISAKLAPGTYYLEVNNAAFRPVDLGDGVRRTGPFPGNVYSVSFFLDG
jgi:hypothetical protein